MFRELFKEKSNLRRYYASQAMVGLLASGRLDNLLTIDNRLNNPDGAQQIAKLAFVIADTMIDTARETDQKSKASAF